VSHRDPIESYLVELRRRLRWRRGRERLSEEVEDHLREAAHAEQAQGIDRAEAARRAVEQVGAPGRIVPRRRVGVVIAVCALIGAVLIVGVVLTNLGSGHRAAGRGGSFSLPEIITSVGAPDVASASVDTSGKSGMGVVVDLALSGGGSSRIEDYWKALLVAGAYRDQSGGKVTALKITTPYESGITVIDVGPPTPGTSDESAATADIKTRLARLGLVPLMVSFAHPTGLAPIVIAQTTNPAALLTGDRESVAHSVFGSLQQYDGTYLRVVDDTGHLVLETGFSVRTGQGVGQYGPRYSPLAG
jgi:hypothetical protein